MEGRTGQRTQSHPFDINNNLEASHKLICRAGFLIVTMLVKRVFWRANINEAVFVLETALKYLKELQGDPNGRTKN